MRWYNYLGYVGFFAPFLSLVVYMNYVNGGLPAFLIGLGIAAWFLGCLFLMYRRAK